MKVKDISTEKSTKTDAVEIQDDMGTPITEIISAGGNLILEVGFRYRVNFDPNDPLRIEIERT